MSLQPSRLPEELLHTFVSVVIVVAVGADPCVCPEFFCTARPAHLGARHTIRSLTFSIPENHPILER
jgi:hypothetical protein